MGNSMDVCMNDACMAVGQDSGLPNFVRPNDDSTLTYSYDAFRSEFITMNGFKMVQSYNGFLIPDSKFYTIKLYERLPLRQCVSVSGRVHVMYPSPPESLQDGGVNLFSVCLRGSPLYAAVPSLPNHPGFHRFNSGVFFSFFLMEHKGKFVLQPRISIVGSNCKEVVVAGDDLLGPIHAASFYLDFAVVDLGGQDCQVDVIIRSTRNSTLRLCFQERVTFKGLVTTKDDLKGRLSSLRKLPGEASTPPDTGRSEHNSEQLTLNLGLGRSPTNKNNKEFHSPSSVARLNLEGVNKKREDVIFDTMRDTCDLTMSIGYGKSQAASKDASIYIQNLYVSETPIQPPNLTATGEAMTMQLHGPNKQLLMHGGLPAPFDLWAGATKSSRSGTAASLTASPAQTLHGLSPGGPHPDVVLMNDMFNHQHRFDFAGGQGGGSSSGQLGVSAGGPIVKDRKKPRVLQKLYMGKNGINALFYSTLANVNSTSNLTKIEKPPLFELHPQFQAVSPETVVESSGFTRSWHHFAYEGNRLVNPERQMTLNNDTMMSPLKGEFWLSREAAVASTRKPLYMHFSSTAAQALTMGIGLRFRVATDFLALIEEKAASLLNSSHIPTDGFICGVEEDLDDPSLLRMFIERRNVILAQTVFGEAGDDLHRMVIHQEVVDTSDDIVYRVTTSGGRDPAHGVLRINLKEIQAEFDKSYFFSSAPGSNPADRIASLSTTPSDKYPIVPYITGGAQSNSYPGGIMEELSDHRIFLYSSVAYNENDALGYTELLKQSNLLTKVEQQEQFHSPNSRSVGGVNTPGFNTPGTAGYVTPGTVPDFNTPGSMATRYNNSVPSTAPIGAQQNPNSTQNGADNNKLLPGELIQSEFSCSPANNEEEASKTVVWQRPVIDSLVVCRLSMCPF